MASPVNRQSPRQILTPCLSILWLDHIEMVTENTGINPLKVGISKLRGLALGSITTICKEGHLMWYGFRQQLTEHYSNMPYASDTMYAYSHLSQGVEEPTTQYLSRSKVLLEHSHHTTKLSSISGVGWDNLYLLRGLRALHMRRGVASKQDSWRMMEGVFNTIDCISRTEDRNKIYSESNFETVPQVAKEWVHEVSTQGQTQPIKPTMAPVAGHNTVLVSGTGSIAVANPVGTTVAISLIEASGRWSSITVKGSITSKTAKNLPGTRPNTN